MAVSYTHLKEGEKDVKITWAPSEDPEGSEVTYIVYVDGVIVSESDKTEYTSVSYTHLAV